MERSPVSYLSNRKKDVFQRLPQKKDSEQWPLGNCLFFSSFFFALVFYLHDLVFKLKKRLYDAKIKFNICEICGISDWNDKPLECELDHIDGNSSNHKLENLRILCPNCHSQTTTFRAKNIKKH